MSQIIFCSDQQLHAGHFCGNKSITVKSNNMKTLLRNFFFGTSLGNNKVMNTGWLLFRLHIGLSIAIHAGWPKMSTLAAPGWFNDQVAGLGFTFPSPAFWATAASWGEFVGGICIALGLLTRFNALQLAFQFFVISFLWYDNPEPLTGMYFQNTLFMGFLLVLFAGGGNYSLDKLIMNRRIPVRGNFAKAAVAGVFVLTGMISQAQSTRTDDIKPAEGKWKGVLTYLDYTSNTKESIKVNAEVGIPANDQLTIEFYYTDEPSHNNRQLLVIKEGGKIVDDKLVVEKTRLLDGSVRIVLESKGEDGNDHRKALFHEVLVISANHFSISKWVKFDGETEFFERNKYVFSR